MGIDSKYGKVTVEHPGPEDDEPVVVFRARDEVLPHLLHVYRNICEERGSPEHHLEQISKTLDTMIRWQIEHKDLVRTPNSNRWAERTGKLS